MEPRIQYAKTAELTVTSGQSLSRAVRAAVCWWERGGAGALEPPISIGGQGNP